MIYLSVPPNASRWELVMGTGIGVMMTPKSGVRLERTKLCKVWACDTGCYAQGNSFDLACYLNWLRRMSPARATCLFATAPDVVEDAQATWERARDVLPQIKALGYKAALCAQNGIEGLVIEWNSFDCLFVGGDDVFKLAESTYELVKEAKARGKHTHMGRVNSRARLIAATVSGYDSADGTHTAFGPDKRLSQLIHWLAELERQGRFIV